MKLKLTASGFDLSTELEKYAAKKAERLERIIPKQLRNRASCTVDFRQVTRKNTKINTCTLTLIVADETLQAKESTVHMYAALDIACVHVAQQLSDYAAAHRKRRLTRLLRRLTWR